MAHEVFISYAHLDDQSGREESGWVQYLLEQLEYRLAKVRGEWPSIWIDFEFKGNEKIEDIRLQHVRKSRSLVAVASPAYCNSPYCAEELADFVGSQIDTSLRGVFKVNKLPLPLEEQPTELRDYRGYDFYIQPRGRNPMELTPYEVVGHKEQYQLELNDLAWDIKQYLSDLETSGTYRDTGDQQRPAVFLAEVTRDLHALSKDVRRELTREGFRVLPERYLPTTETRESVEQHVRDCRVSVHLLGERYGLIPEGERDSIVDIQLQICRQRAETGVLQTVVGLPPNLVFQETRQKEFVEALRNDPGPIDILRGSLGEVKQAVSDRLRATEDEADLVGTDTDRPTAYLIHELEDGQIADRLHSEIDGRGISVLRPLFDEEEDPRVLREDHADSLNSVDGVLILWGTGRLAWIRAKLAEIRKIRGYGRIRPYLARAICVGEPASPQKSGYSNDEYEVFSLSEGLDGGVLDEFAKLLLSGSGAMP